MACGGDFDEPSAACAQSCQGCCSGDTCFEGTQGSACGAGGSICDKCEGLEECTTRAEGARSCYFDKSVQWRVQPASAVISKTNEGEDWDVDGSPPDVVVNLECPSGDRELKSQTPEASGFSPAWTEGGCTTTLGDLLARTVEIEVVDVDVTFDDVMVQQNIQLRDEDFKKGSFTLPLPNQEGGMLVLSLTRIP